MMATDQSVPMQIDDQGMLLVKELAEIRAKTSALKKRSDEIRDELLAVLTELDATRAITASGDPAIHVTSIQTTRVNRKKLEARYPDVFSDVVETSESKKLEIDIPIELLGVRSEL
jgi:hypothetical protein